MKKQAVNYVIQTLVPEHWDAVSSIYEKGIATGNATFQTAAPLSWNEWDKSHLDHSRFIARINDTIVGWVALSPTSSRECYKGVCELSIYVDPDFSGNGIGSSLLDTVIQSSEENGIWTICSSTFPENKASISLQKKFAFREIGYREKIARQNGIWRNTVLLERRSNKVGV
ncbi:MAG: N-acetyltransferase family protein [Flavitalea sp.]